MTNKLIISFILVVPNTYHNKGIFWLFLLLRIAVSMIGVHFLAVLHGVWNTAVVMRWLLFIIIMIIIFVVSTPSVVNIYYTYVSDDKPPPSDSDDSLLDMMIRDGDFTKGFYTNVFACGLMLTNVCRINANNTIIIIQNVSCKPARDGRLKVICFRWFYRTIIRYNNMHCWMPKKKLCTNLRYAQHIKRLKITLLL